METRSAFISGWWNGPGSFALIETSCKASHVLVEGLNNRIRVATQGLQLPDDEYLKLDVFVVARLTTVEEQDMIRSCTGDAEGKNIKAQKLR